MTTRLCTPFMETGWKIIAIILSICICVIAAIITLPQNIYYYALVTYRTAILRTSLKTLIVLLLPLAVILLPAVLMIMVQLTLLPWFMEESFIGFPIDPGEKIQHILTVVWNKYHKDIGKFAENYGHASGIPENWNGKVYGLSAFPFVVVTKNLFICAGGYITGPWRILVIPFAMLAYSGHNSMLVSDIARNILFDVNKKLKEMCRCTTRLILYKTQSFSGDESADDVPKKVKKEDRSLQYWAVYTQRITQEPEKTDVWQASDDVMKNGIDRGKNGEDVYWNECNTYNELGATSAHSTQRTSITLIKKTDAKMTSWILVTLLLMKRSVVLLHIQ